MFIYDHPLYPNTRARTLSLSYPHIYYLRLLSSDIFFTRNTLYVLHLNSINSTYFSLHYVKLLLFTILVLSVYNFIFPVNPPPPPHPLSHPTNCNLPCEILVSSRTVHKTFFSYNYITADLIKIIFLLFLWVCFLSSDINCIYVRYVNFRWNLSNLTLRDETNLFSSHIFQTLVYFYTFLTLYEPFLLIFVFDFQVIRPR